jgi:hypothetical protein
MMPRVCSAHCSSVRSLPNSESAPIMTRATVQPGPGTSADVGQVTHAAWMPAAHSRHHSHRAVVSSSKKESP